MAGGGGFWDVICRHVLVQCGNTERQQARYLLDNILSLSESVSHENHSQLEQLGSNNDLVPPTCHPPPPAPPPSGAGRGLQLSGGHEVRLQAGEKHRPGAPQSSRQTEV